MRRTPTEMIHCEKKLCIKQFVCLGLLLFLQLNIATSKPANGNKLLNFQVKVENLIDKIIDYIGKYYSYLQSDYKCLPEEVLGHLVDIIKNSVDCVDFNEQVYRKGFVNKKNYIKNDKQCLENAKNEVKYAMAHINPTVNYCPPNKAKNTLTGNIKTPYINTLKIHLRNDTEFLKEATQTNNQLTSLESLETQEQQNFGYVSNVSRFVRQTVGDQENPSINLKDIARNFINFNKESLVEVGRDLFVYIQNSTNEKEENEFPFLNNLNWGNSTVTSPFKYVMIVSLKNMIPLITDILPKLTKLLNTFLNSVSYILYPNFTDDENLTTNSKIYPLNDNSVTSISGFETTNRAISSENADDQSQPFFGDGTTSDNSKETSGFGDGKLRVLFPSYNRKKENPSNTEVEVKTNSNNDLVKTLREETNAGGDFSKTSVTHTQTTALPDFDSTKNNKNKTDGQISSKRAESSESNPKSKNTQASSTAGSSTTNVSIYSSDNSTLHSKTKTKTSSVENFQISSTLSTENISEATRLRSSELHSSISTVSIILKTPFTQINNSSVTEIQSIRLDEGKIATASETQSTPKDYAYVSQETKTQSTPSDDSSLPKYKTESTYLNQKTVRDYIKNTETTNPQLRHSDPGDFFLRNNTLTDDGQPNAWDTPRATSKPQTQNTQSISEKPLLRKLDPKDENQSKTDDSKTFKLQTKSTVIELTTEVTQVSDLDKNDGIIQTDVSQTAKGVLYRSGDISQPNSTPFLGDRSHSPSQTQSPSLDTVTENFKTQNYTQKLRYKNDMERETFKTLSLFYSNVPILFPTPSTKKVLKFKTEKKRKEKTSSETPLNTEVFEYTSLGDQPRQFSENTKHPEEQELLTTITYLSTKPDGINYSSETLLDHFNEIEKTTTQLNLSSERQLRFNNHNQKDQNDTDLPTTSEKYMSTGGYLERSLLDDKNDKNSDSLKPENQTQNLVPQPGESSTQSDIETETSTPHQKLKPIMRNNKISKANDTTADSNSDKSVSKTGSTPSVSFRAPLKPEVQSHQSDDENKTQPTSTDGKVGVLKSEVYLRRSGTSSEVPPMITTSTELHENSETLSQKDQPNGFIKKNEKQITGEQSTTINIVSKNTEMEDTNNKILPTDVKQTQKDNANKISPLELQTTSLSGTVLNGESTSKVSETSKSVEQFRNANEKISTEVHLTTESITNTNLLTDSQTTVINIGKESSRSEVQSLHINTGTQTTRISVSEADKNSKNTTPVVKFKDRFFINIQPLTDADSVADVSEDVTTEEYFTAMSDFEQVLIDVHSEPLNGTNSTSLYEFKLRGFNDSDETPLTINPSSEEKSTSVNNINSELVARMLKESEETFEITSTQSDSETKTFEDKRQNDINTEKPNKLNHYTTEVQSITDDSNTSGKNVEGETTEQITLSKGDFRRFFKIRKTQSSTAQITPNNKNLLFEFETQQYTTTEIYTKHHHNPLGHGHASTQKPIKKKVNVLIKWLINAAKNFFTEYYDDFSDVETDEYDDEEDENLSQYPRALLGSKKNKYKKFLWNRKKTKANKKIKKH